MVYIEEFRGFNITPAQLNLISKARAFYRDLAVWTRAYLESIYAGFNNLEAVKQRLDYIPEKYSYIFRLFFGDKITDEYTSYLIDFVNNYEALVAAQINGDTNAVNEYTKRLYESADKRAAYLAQINPFWQEIKWKNLFYEYIRLLIEESSTFLSKQYDRNIESYSRLMDHVNQMGDYLSEGLFRYINYPVKTGMFSVSQLGNLTITPEQMDVIFKARAFYRDLAIWIRSYLVGVYAGLGNLNAVREKLYQVPVKSANVFRSFFGDKITEEEYTNPVIDLIKTYEALVAAQIAGDANAVNQYTEQMYKYADTRAAYLSKINPFWQEAELKQLLYEFIRLVINESTSFLTKDYKGNIEVFDDLMENTYQIGDYIAAGLLYYLTYSARPTPMPKF